MKKFIHLSLITALLVNSLHADIMTDALSNVTHPVSYTKTNSSGKAVSSNFYTGGVAFRFGNTAIPQPLWSFSPPQLKVGCSGFNLKGMFVSLLNLDQLGAMLQNAGASLAWGVAIGLIYSLPGVSAAFKFINEWATKIQQLLANSCQSGMAIGEALGKDGFGMKDLDKTITSYLPSSTAASTLQEGTKGLHLDSLGLKFDAENGLLSYSGGNNQALSSSQKKDAFTALLSKSYGMDISLGGALFSNYMKNNFPTAYDSLVSSLNPNGSKALNTYAIPITYAGSAGSFSITSLSKSATGDITQENKQSMAWLTWVLAWNLVGDIGESDEDLKNIENTFEPINAVSNGTATQAQNDAVASLITNPTSFGAFKRELVGPGAMQPASSQGTVLAQFLYYGVSPKPAVVDANGTTDGSDMIAQRQAFKDSIYAPTVMVAMLKEQNSDKYGIQPYMKSGRTDQKFFDASNDFVGIESSSLCAIHKMVDKTSGGSDCGLVPLFDGVEKYVKIIQQSPVSERESLISLLSALNIDLAGNAILDQMFDSMKSLQSRKSERIVSDNSKATSSNNVGGNGGNVQDDQIILAYNQRMSELVKSAKEEMRKLTNNIDKNSVNNIFDEQDIRNREAGIKSLKR